MSSINKYIYRKKAIKWLHKIKIYYCIHSEDFIKAIVLFDRYIKIKYIPYSQYNVYIYTCLFIYLKYIEDIIILDISSDIIVYFNSMFYKKYIFNIEMCILKAVNYNISYTTCIDYIKNSERHNTSKILRVCILDIVCTELFYSLHQSLIYQIIIYIISGIHIKKVYY